MQTQSNAEQRITLTEVAKTTPGRPTANCIWRWCRRGVLARNGERVRLEHVRLGGRIFTTRRWLDEFGRALAEADARYFSRSQSAVAEGTTSKSRGHPQENSKTENERARELERIEQELEEVGL